MAIIPGVNLLELQYKLQGLDHKKLNMMLVIFLAKGIDPWFSLNWWTYGKLKSFTWEHPFWLYAVLFIPVIFLIRALWSLWRKQQLHVAFQKDEIKRSHLAYLRFIPILFLACALIFLCIALARPQRTSEQVERWSEGIDIMLVMDISESMKIEDFIPNRLEAAKKVATNFINGRFQDRIGIVVFAGEAYSLSPLTTDYDLLKTYLGDIDFKQIEKPGTAIGSALGIAINRMRESKATSKVIILLSDGDNTAGNLDPLAAADLAHAYGIKLYTVLIGKEGRVPFGKDFFGNPQYVDNSVDETTLKKIASIGEGEFFRASTNTMLKDVFAKIDRYERSEIKETRYKNTDDFYTMYLKWAVVFFLAWLFTKITFVTNFLED